LALLWSKPAGGAIEAGRFAHLITVDSDPIADIAELERVKFVMKDGQVCEMTLRRIEGKQIAATTNRGAGK
jgi:hypothetical protein